MSLDLLLSPILFTVFAWWFSTGAILWLVRRPERQHGLVFASLTLTTLAGVAGIVATAGDTSATATYTAFTCALIIWGWHEASFLLGFLTGPRPEACPPGAKGWPRFVFATLTVLHHEIALALTLLGLAILTWGQPQQVATWTFAILFAMRLSAKFNIFLGVPNLTDEFFPERLEHLKSYLPKRPMNALFPVSVVASIVLAAGLMQMADKSAPGTGESIGFILLFALTLLALIEHAFMVLPLPDAALWRWAAPQKTPPGATSTGTVSGVEAPVPAFRKDGPTPVPTRHPVTAHETL